MKLEHKIVRILIIFLLTGNVSHAQSIDYQSQVLFMYNFIKYVNWPSSDDNFTIVVLGTSPIADELKKLASIKKTPGGKSIVIVQTNDINSISNCQMLYVTDSKSKEIQNIIKSIKDKPTLIVGQRDGLAKKGASINFYTQDDDRLGFAVNRKDLDVKKIKMAGELIRFAELVD